MDVKTLEDLYNDKTKHTVDSVFKRARWVTVEEGNLLYSIVVEEEPSHIYESGTANGYSTMWMSIPGISVTTFDPVSRGKVWDVLDGKPDHVTYVESKFEEVVNVAKDTIGKKMFFIDGLHTSGGLNEDTAAVKKIISPGDVLIYHDLNIENVVRCWDRINDFASSHQNYDTRRGMGKMIWGSK